MESGGRVEGGAFSPDDIKAFAQQVAYDDALQGREPNEQNRLLLLRLAESACVSEPITTLRNWLQEASEAGSARRREEGRLDKTAQIDLDIEAKTDVDNSLRFVDKTRDKLRYCYERKCWYSWVGHRWKRDSGDVVPRYAEKVIREQRRIAKRLLSSAASCPDSKERKFISENAERMLRHAERSESLPKRKAMCDGAQHHLKVDACKLDSNDWLLGCENGVVDLKTGQLRPGRHDDYITKSTGIAFDPTAECPRFERFLLEIMDGDSELVSFLQRFAGYCLTGDTREECLLLAVGPKASNGKSTLIGTLETVFGDYSKAVSFDLFLSDVRGRNKGPELAELDGIRLITALEPSAGKTLDEGLVKRLTGRDTVPVEAKYEQPRNIVVRGKIVLACNSPPRFPNGGSAIQRRLRVVPFDVVFTGDRDDKDLPEKLKAEASGILAWAVQGCLDWQRRGLEPPDSVKTAIHEYVAEADPLADWLEADTINVPHAETPLSQLHRSYANWAEEAGITHPFGIQRFGPMLRERGFTSRKTKRGQLFQGVALTSRNHEVVTTGDDDAESPYRESRNSLGKSLASSSPIVTEQAFDFSDDPGEAAFRDENQHQCDES